MSFEFDKEKIARYWLPENNKCVDCGEYHGCQPHHIFPRSSVTECSRSIFNCGSIGDVCHLDHDRLCTRETQERLIYNTAKFLHENGYKPTQEDLDFIQNNRLWKIIIKVIE